MEHFFTLPVNCEGQEHEFQGRLVTFGYTYKYYIIVDKHEIIFERDDEMNLRALNTAQPTENTIEKSLLAAIAATLDQLTTP